MRVTAEARMRGRVPATLALAALVAAARRAAVAPRALGESAAAAGPVAAWVAVMLGFEMPLLLSRMSLWGARAAVQAESAAVVGGPVPVGPLQQGERPASRRRRRNSRRPVPVGPLQQGERQRAA